MFRARTTTPKLSASSTTPYKYVITPEECKDSIVFSDMPDASTIQSGECKNSDAQPSSVSQPKRYVANNTINFVTKDAAIRQGRFSLFEDVNANEITINGNYCSSYLRTPEELEGHLLKIFGEEKHVKNLFAHYSLHVADGVGKRCAQVIEQKKILINFSRKLLKGKNKDQDIEVPPANIFYDRPTKTVYFETFERVQFKDFGHKNGLGQTENHRSQESCMVKTLYKLTREGFELVSWSTNQPIIAGLLKNDKDLLKRFLKTSRWEYIKNNKLKVASSVLLGLGALTIAVGAVFVPALIPVALPVVGKMGVTIVTGSALCTGGVLGFAGRFAIHAGRSIYAAYKKCFAKPVAVEPVAAKSENVSHTPQLKRSTSVTNIGQGLGITKNDFSARFEETKGTDPTPVAKSKPGVPDYVGKRDSAFYALCCAPTSKK